MPEIGYWKYVRFTDDEPLWFGTDDDITIVFDSADDRLEYRMKKDIRFEDDTGVGILAIEKATRTLSGFKMSGNLEIEKASPQLILDSQVSGNPFIGFLLDGTPKAYFSYSRATGELMISDPGVADTFKIDVVTGNITKVGDIDMGGNLLKNAKLGTMLDAQGQIIAITQPGGRLEYRRTEEGGYRHIYFRCHNGIFDHVPVQLRLERLIYATDVNPRRPMELQLRGAWWDGAASVARAMTLAMRIDPGGNEFLTIADNANAEVMRIDKVGRLYLSSDGTPSGGISGMIAVDPTGSKIWLNCAGVWKSVTLT